MKNLIIGLILMATTSLIAQLPISHQSGVSFTYSGSYYAPGGASSVNFLMCDSWNSGTYGGWLQMDLGTSITLESLRWWVGMFPNGNVQTELVEVSANGTDWTLAANTSGPHVSLEEIKLEFDPVITNVRYIRISQSGTPSWFSILEMVVNEPYYAHNVYENLPPKILDNLGKELTEPVSGFPYNFICSKAATYQWYKDGVIISGATSQDYMATTEGSYSCEVSYTSANCGFSTTSDPIPLTPALPLDLLSFSIAAEKDNVVLNWEVAHLINFSHFDIQRSLDGSNFKTIDQKNAIGEGQYTYVDISPEGGIIYYRLKMIDNDGRFKYTSIIAQNLNKIELKVYPNPVYNRLHINSNKEEYHFYIYDVLGRFVYQGQSSEKNTSIPVFDLPKGWYYLKVDTFSTESTVRFMVK